MAVQSVPSLNGVSKQPYASFGGKSEAAAVAAGRITSLTLVTDITRITALMLFLKELFYE